MATPDVGVVACKDSVLPVVPTESVFPLVSCLVFILYGHESHQVLADVGGGILTRLDAPVDVSAHTY